jgi:hypothetical protein
MSVRLHALRAGFSTLAVSYQYKEIQLKATVTVGAYFPLQVHVIGLLSCDVFPGPSTQKAGPLKYSQNVFLHFLLYLQHLDL